MGNMVDWAKREVEIACKRETPNRKDGEWDYGCACYESALKAYLSLMEDEHSGMSFSITRSILTRLMEGKPLTPIEDAPEEWNEVSVEDNGERMYQHRRMSGLFKHVGPDGAVRYNDVNRVCCRNRNEPKNSYHSGHASRLIHELYPITMPYNPPTGHYELTCEEWLTDRRNGDFDTWAYLTLKKPNGESEGVFRYFKEGENGAVEIDVHEYGLRVMAAKVREKREKRDAAEQAEQHGATAKPETT